MHGMKCEMSDLARAGKSFSLRNVNDEECFGQMRL